MKFIDQFRSMNFVGDQEMAQQLDQVRKELLSRTAEDYRDDVFARHCLVGGLNRLSEEARKLAKQDATELVQRFGELRSCWKYRPPGQRSDRSIPLARRPPMKPRDNGRRISPGRSASPPRR